MPGSAARLTALLRALLVAFAPTAAAAVMTRPVRSADSPADVALAVGLTSTAAAATAWWLRSRYRRDADADGGDR